MANHDIESCVKKAVTEYVEHLDGEAETQGMYRMIMGEVESVLIKLALEYSHNNQSQAAKWLGITRTTLKKKIDDYHLL